MMDWGSAPGSGAGLKAWPSLRVRCSAAAPPKHLWPLNHELASGRRGDLATPNLFASQEF